MTKILKTLPAPKQNDTGYAFAIKVCCRECRSESVTRDGITRWSQPDQVWELSSVMDEVACDDCGCTRLVERHVDQFGNEAGPVSESDLFEDEEAEPPTEVVIELPRKIEISASEHDTMLAALRFYESYLVLNADFTPPSVDHIATEHGPALKSDEINALCERIN